MMHDNNAFSVTRAWYALRADLVQHSRAVLVGAGSAAALVLAIGVLAARNAHDAALHAGLFPLVLVVGGVLFTSSLFTDLHDKPRAHAYLTLPVSTLERWLARLLLSTVGVAAVALAGYFLVSLVGAGVSGLVWGRSHGIFAPDADAWLTVLRYLVISSLFLFGAVYFRRWHAFKVVLSVSGLWLALTLLAVGLAWLLFPGLFAVLGRDVDLKDLPPGLSETIGLGAKILFWAVIGPLFWFLTYLRLREAEV